MFRKNEWKEEIHKDDLLSVLLNGGLAAVLGGILSGSLDYLFNMLNFPISFGILILVYLISWRVKRSFYSYHILYPVLAMVFLLIGFFFSYFSFYVIYYVLVLKTAKFYLILGLSSFWVGFLTEPASELIFGISNASFLYIALGIINIIIYIWAFFFTFRWVKGRN